MPDEDGSLDIRPDAFVTRSGFLRAGEGPESLPRAGEGPPWTFDEADRQAHEFLRLLTGERELETRLDDPVEHARANGLMLLFSADAEDAFETYLARMPVPRAEAWRDLIAGGASSEAFGPLTLQERLDERQVADALRSGRTQRVWSFAAGIVLFTAAVIGAVLAWNTWFTDDERTTGALRFEPASDDGDDGEVVAGGPPVVDARLTEALTTTVAVLAGDGPAEDRVTTAPFSSFPHPPGALRASLFDFGGSGQVVIVGPEGFTADSCLRASVVTEDLRPFDVVTTGPCVEPVGRPASIGCLGSSAVMIALDVPGGEVTLPEGGSGFAAAVRVQLVGDDPAYEVLSLRATIEVATGEDVTVPRFGGAPGDELTFDLGAGVVGRCELTGVVVGRS